MAVDVIHTSDDGWTWNGENNAVLVEEDWSEEGYSYVGTVLSLDGKRIAQVRHSDGVFGFHVTIDEDAMGADEVECLLAALGFALDS